MVPIAGGLILYPDKKNIKSDKSYLNCDERILESHYFGDYLFCVMCFRANKLLALFLCVRKVLLYIFLFAS